MSEQYIFQPIGVIRSPYHEKSDVPIQPSLSPSIGQVEVFSEFTDGLSDIEGFSHIVLLYVFHRSEGYDLLVKPFLDDRPHGLFSTRYPRRPNPIGLSIVRLMKVSGPILEIGGVDVLDGTPLLDIKPYIPGFDVAAASDQQQVGWYANRSEE